MAENQLEAIESRFELNYEERQRDIDGVEDDEEQELPEHWYFTFGFDHVHPETGESLANHFVVIVGDVNSSREIMEHRFGKKWAFQYPSAEAAGVVKHGLKQLPFTQPAPAGRA